MRILVTGGRGLLGSEFGRTPEIEVLRLAHSELDILHAEHVGQVLQRHSPQWLVNCAAFTRVDDCEENDQAFCVNALGPEVLARACHAASVRLLHFSTDYVFDGTKNRPYTEEDPPNPINAYGRSKLEGENRALNAYPEGVVIVRTAWLFGTEGRCFPRSIIEAAKENRPLRVVADQTGSPTYARDLANAVESWLREGPTPGIYHLVNEGQTTWFGLAKATLEAAGIDAQLESVTSAEWGARAPRPKYSALRTVKKAPRLRPWKQALEEFVRELLATRG